MLNRHTNTNSLNRHLNRNILNRHTNTNILVEHTKQKTFKRAEVKRINWKGKSEDKPNRKEMFQQT
jgi:hypothetical protein